MSFKKFIVIPVFVAVQAMGLMFFALAFPGEGIANGLSKMVGHPLVGGAGLLTFVTFQAWAMYFMAGCTIPGAVKTVLGYIGGIIASIAIFELAGAFGAFEGAKWAFPIAVLIVVVPVMCMEKVPWMDFIPAWFVGAGMFFAMMTLYNCGDASCGAPRSHYMACAVPEMIGCIVGMVFGWITVTFQGWYTKKVGAAQPEAEAA